MADDEKIYWNGESYEYEDLSFREQRKLRELLRENVDPVDFDDPGAMDVIPALVTVIAQRTDPDFTWEKALDLKPSDLQAPAPPPKPRRKS